LLAATLFTGAVASYSFGLVEGLLPFSPTAKDGDVHSSFPGVRLPPTRTVAEATLQDGDEVIGICAGGRERAYFIRAMGAVIGGPKRHVVNDLLGGHAVSITWCDRTGCSRAFTGGPAREPLELGVGGWLKGGLALRVGDADYSQETGECLSDPGGPPIPYTELRHERTTWKAWRQAHPNTDVYVGDQPREQATPGGPQTDGAHLPPAKTHLPSFN
jgi:hypothetical protein